MVIPARLESRRFPGKVLARETGKYLVQHVYESVLGVPGVTRVIVATDSDEVLDAARSFGAEARMTSREHISGTDRVAEVVRDLEEEIVINVQGDEPTVRREDLSRLVEVLRPDRQPASVMATLARPRSDPEGVRDPNLVKVVRSLDGRALYFSRSPLPGRPAGPIDGETNWLHHIGIYGFRRDFLQVFTSLSPGVLERRERLEQLRALEHGYPIEVLTTDHEYEGIDTEEEYRAFVARVGAG